MRPGHCSSPVRRHVEVLHRAADPRERHRDHHRLLGVVCLLTLPVAQYPNIVPPTIQVIDQLPGRQRRVVAKTVGIPIEQAINGVENSIYMQSTSGSDGSYTLTVTFAIGTDLDTSLALVQNAANAALPQLPTQVQAQGVNVRRSAPTSC